jgi:hypothetical protein
VVDVYLNFSSRARKLDLDLQGARERGCLLFSTERVGLAPPEAEYSLAPFEGVLLLSPG